MISQEARNLVELMGAGSYSKEAMEIKSWVFYDTHYFRTTVQDLIFFTQPVGSPSWVGGVPKTLNETNMRDAGKLPNGQSFVCTSLAAALTCPLPTENVLAPQYAKAFQNIMHSSVFNLAIANKSPEVSIHGADLFPRPIFSSGRQATTAGANMPFICGEGVSMGWRDLNATPVIIGDGNSFSVEWRVEQTNASLLVGLNADATLLNGVYATIIFMLSGYTMHKK